MRKNHKRAAVLATGALVLGSTGVAYAYWTTTGSGTGVGSTMSGDVDTPSALTFDQDSINAMYPGDSPQALTVTVTNGDTESYYVSSVKAYITTDKGTSCTGADFLLGGDPTADPAVPGSAAPSTAATATPLTWSATELSGGGGNADATSYVQFNDTGANQDGCKGATVTIHYIAG